MFIIYKKREESWYISLYLKYIKNNMYIYH